jgi:hypothetical protein
VRLVKDFLTLLLASSFLPSCASAPAPSRVATCLTDPTTNSMHCDGVSYPWEQMGGYVCVKLEDWEAYAQGCR